MKKIVLTSFFIISFSLLAEARIFSNAFISFELPDSWNCKQQETEWICRHQEDRTAKEAIIIFTAKQVGPTDTLDEYVRHLSMQQNSGARAKGIPSTIIDPPRKIMIQNHPWIDSTHRGSEIKDYMTRYLATVEDQIAIAFSFTAHKDSYTKYTGTFFKAAQTLKVTSRKSGVTTQAPPMVPGLPHIQETNIDVTATPAPPLQTTSSNGKAKAFLFIVALLTGLTAIYMMLKNKKR